MKLPLNNQHCILLAAKDNGLKKMSGTNWFGCLFLNHNTEAEGSQLHKKLEELTRRLHALGCFENNLTFITSETFPHKCNWKVAVRLDINVLFKNVSGVYMKLCLVVV